MADHPSCNHPFSYTRYSHMEPPPPQKVYVQTMQFEEFAFVVESRGFSYPVFSYPVKLMRPPQHTFLEYAR